MTTSFDQFLGLHVALSPGACVMVALDEDGEVQLEKMHYMHGSLVEMDENDGMLGISPFLQLELTVHRSQTRRDRRCGGTAV
jgi:hypothetical protein